MEESIPLLQKRGRKGERGREGGLKQIMKKTENEIDAEGERVRYRETERERQRQAEGKRINQMKSKTQKRERD